MNVRMTAKYAVGAFAHHLLKPLGREIDANTNLHRAAKLKRTILYYRTCRARARGETVELETDLSTFWKGEAGDSFHASYIDYRVALFEEIHVHVIDEVARIADANGPFHRLIEIGCGGGEVLARSAPRIGNLTEIIGLDINTSAIERARKTHADRPDLRFEVADLRVWLGDNPAAGTVLLSYGGVLEYFSQSSVRRIFETLATKPPALVILVEPVAPDHDLARRQESFAFGAENSFSHNHAALLRSAGFSIAFSEIVEHDGTRWMLMIGVHRSGKADAIQ